MKEKKKHSSGFLVPKVLVIAVEKGPSVEGYISEDT